MKTPHTSAAPNSPVFVKLRDGTSFRDVFLERTGKYVVLKEHGRIRGKEIRSMGRIKGSEEHLGMTPEQRELNTLQRERSKAHLGMPKPSRILHDGPKGGSHKGPQDYTLLDEVPAENFIQLHPHSDLPVPGAPRLSTTANLNVHTPTRIQPRAEKHKAAPVRIFTEEQKAEMNFTLNQQQAQAVEVTKAAPVAQEGSIEATLASADKKAKWHRSQVQYHQLEAERWATVADKLKEALGLATGKITPSAASATTQLASRPKGFWKQAITDYLEVDSNKQPMIRKLLIQSIATKHSAGVDVVYQAVSKLLRDSYLIEVEGGVALSSWTDPQGAK